MDYSSILRCAWRLVRSENGLWWLGLLAVLPQAAGHLLRLSGSLLLPVDFTDPANWQTILERWVNDPPALSWGVLVGGTAVLFLLLLLVWLLLVWVEGAIIHIVHQAGQGTPVSLAAGLRRGRALLGRFIAIDTAVFFPLFLVLLLLLGCALALLLGTIGVALSGADPEAVFVVWGVSGVGALPLLCLLLPVGFVTLLWRTLAFRETAVAQTGVKASLRRSWQLLKRQAGPLLIWAAILAGIPYLVGWLRYLLFLPAVGGFISSERPLLGAIFFALNLLFTIGFIGLQGFIRAFTLTTWTLVFIELRAEN